VQNAGKRGFGGFFSILLRRWVGWGEEEEVYAEKV